MPDRLTEALAKLRVGTEVLRTGGGAELTSGDCNAVLDQVERLTDEVAGRPTMEYVRSVEKDNERLARDLAQHETIITVQERQATELRNEVDMHIAALDALEHRLFGDVKRRSRDEMEAQAERQNRGKTSATSAGSPFGGRMKP